MAEQSYARMPLDARVITANNVRRALEIASEGLAMLVKDAVNAGDATSAATTRMADALTDLRPALDKTRTVPALMMLPATPAQRSRDETAPEPPALVCLGAPGPRRS